MGGILEKGGCVREGKWTQSIAIGSERFVKNIMQALRIRKTGRKVVEFGETYKLRESQVSYQADYDLEKDDIEAGNIYLWNVY
jgi:putative transposase